MITALKIVFIAILLWMSYVVVSTSLKSNLFKEWNFLATIPWMRATLWDFYANVFVIYAWIWYKESSIWLRLLWLVLMICLGSIASCIYILIELFRLAPGEGIHELLVKQHD